MICGAYDILLMNALRAMLDLFTYQNKCNKSDVDFCCFLLLFGCVCMNMSYAIRSMPFLSFVLIELFQIHYLKLFLNCLIHFHARILHLLSCGIFNLLTPHCARALVFHTVLSVIIVISHNVSVAMCSLFHQEY